MAIKRLEDQIAVVEDKIIQAQLSGKTEDIGQIGVEFTKLRWILDGLTSFVEHRWQVKLFIVVGTEYLIEIRAEHLVEAREKAIELFDDNDTAIRYELYCDGKLIPEEDQI